MLVRRLLVALLSLVAASATAVVAQPADTVAAADVAEAQQAKTLWTCGMHPQVLQHEPGLCPICGMELTPVRRSAGPQEETAGASVSIDPAMRQRMGVRVAEVRLAPLETRLRAAGRLEEAEPRRHDVDLRVSGWIEKLHADTEGAHVAAGDPLFELYSPEIRVAVEELRAARRAPGSGAERLAEAAREKLRLWGLDEREIARLASLERAPRTVTFRSKAAGHVVEKGVVEGASVTAGTRALRIVDHGVLWLDARVFEQDLPLVSIGQKATATFLGRPEELREGRLSFVHPHVDPKTRSATVRIEIANPDLKLRPGMFATAEIVVDDTAVLQVPRDAVIDTGKRRVVFVDAGEGRFEPREVTIGRSGDGGVEVRSGLTAGERVVTSGQFLLDAESRFQSAIARFLEDGRESGAEGTP